MGQWIRSEWDIKQSCHEALIRNVDTCYALEIFHLFVNCFRNEFMLKACGFIKFWNVQIYVHCYIENLDQCLILLF